MEKFIASIYLLSIATITIGQQQNSLDTFGTSTSTSNNNPFGNPRDGTRRNFTSTLDGSNTFIGPQQQGNFNPGFNPAFSPAFNPAFNPPFNPSNNQRPFNFNRDRERERERDFGSTNFNDPNSYYSYAYLEGRKCPPEWEFYNQNCYRFVKSPMHTRDGARLNCQAYGNGSMLLNVNSLDEHSWILMRLNAIDPQKRKWYISARQDSAGSWVNDDGSQLVSFDQAFLEEESSSFGSLSQFNPLTQSSYNRYLAYSFSERRDRWGFMRVSGSQLYLYICEIPLQLVPLPSDERDFEYGLEILDPKKIPRGPYFIRQPESTVFDLSRTSLRNYISISCVAGGWPSPTYQWFKEEYENSTLIAKIIDPLLYPKYTVSGGTLMIEDPVKEKDRGNYHCVATNQFGSVVSETVTISFGYINEFILARSSDQAKQYWGKSINCDAPQHYPGVYYTWVRKSFPNFVEEDQRTFVSYDGFMYISAVDMSDQGNYSCNVQSKVSPTGRNGPFFNLQVIPNANYQQLKFADNFPKVFPDAPKQGDGLRLECVAFGYPVPSYNWTRRNGDLPRGSQLSSFNRVLTIPGVQVEDQGEYACRATNSRVSIEQKVTVSIQASPIFTIELGNRHVDRGSDLMWVCEAFGIPDVSYQWYRNGMYLNPRELPAEDIGRYNIQDNVLRIRDVDSRRDAGMYQCRANNSLAAKFSSGQLRVLAFAPSFKKHPLDAEMLAAEQGNITIKCEPEAAPKPRTFTWKKDGNIISSSGNRRILPNGNLVINPVKGYEDEGYYTCMVQNAFGQAESTGYMRVLKGPTFVQTLQEKREVEVGSQLKLFCLAEADDSLDIAYIWKHNGLRLERSHRVHVDSKFGYLNIANITLADRGEYECEVTSWVGTVQSFTQVDIYGPPGPPGGVLASDISSTSARIQWTDGASNGAPIYYYTIQGRTQWDSEWKNLTENATAQAVAIRDGRFSSISELGRKEIVLRDLLSPWSVYEFRVLAANNFGFGPPSAPSPQYNTPTNRPFVFPKNLGGGGGKTGSLTISWDPLHPQEQNAPGVYYKVFWRRNNPAFQEEYQSQVLSQWGNIGTHVVSVKRADYYTLYDVKIQAWNTEGSGPESPVEQVYSAEDMPQVTPSLVTPRPFNSTAINVTWIPVEETREKMRGKLVGYRIRYWPKKEENYYDPQALNYLSRSTKPWALILGLQANTYYYVQVMAYNQAGPGPASEAQFERTFKKAPQKPPTSVNVSAIDPHTVKVSWRYVSPSAEEEALSGYKVRIWEADQDISVANDTYIPIESRKTDTIIGGLQPEVTYFLRVLAHSLGGDGKMSSPAKEFTLTLKGGVGTLMSWTPLALAMWSCISLFYR